MWELDCEESWALKNWCFWTVVLEKTLESPLDCMEIQPVHPKGDWSWVFIGRTDVEAETPILWPPDGKSWVIWKDPDAGKDWYSSWNSLAQNTGVGSLSLHQEIFPTQGSNSGLPHCRWILYQLSHIHVAKLCSSIYCINLYSISTVWVHLL